MINFLILLLCPLLCRLKKKTYLCHQLFPLWGKCLLHLIFFLVPIFPHLNPSVSCICWDHTSLFYFIFLNPRANKIKVVLKLKYKGYMENKCFYVIYQVKSPLPENHIRCYYVTYVLLSVTVRRRSKNPVTWLKDHDSIS